MRRLRPSLLLAAALSMLGAAAVTAASPPPDFRQAKTPMGIGYWHGMQPTEPDETVNFGWRDGVIADMPGKEGLMRLGPSQIFAGTADMSDGEYFERMNDLHASASLSAGFETTRGTIRAPKDKFGEVAELAGASLRAPRLADATIDRLRKRFASQARDSDGKPSNMIWKAAMLAVLGDHMQTRANRPEAIEGVTRADIEEWRRRVFSREDLVIVASGPLAPDVLGPMIDRAFGSLPAKGAHKKYEAKDYKLSGRTVVIERDVPQTILLLAGRTSIVPEAGSSKSSIANQILGAGTDSRLLNAIRQDLGAAYGISSGTTAVSSRQRLLSISTSVSHDKAKAALDTIKATYAKWSEGGVTEEEFAPAKAKFVNGYESGIRQPGEAGGSLLALLLDGLDVEVYRTLEARLKAYALGDINAAIKDKFAAPPLTTFIVTPKAGDFAADCVIKAAEEVTGCK